MRKTEAGTTYRAPTKARPKTQERSLFDAQGKQQWLRHTN